MARGEQFGIYAQHKQARSKTLHPQPKPSHRSTCPQLSPSGLAHAPEAAHSPWGQKGDNSMLCPTPRSFPRLGGAGYRNIYLYLMQHGVGKERRYPQGGGKCSLTFVVGNWRGRGMAGEHQLCPETPDFCRHRDQTLAKMPGETSTT